MLKKFFVKDYVLIEQINVDFGKGLNIITGETGAGKSILIDAMSLLLGERASYDVVRKGAVKAIVEGIFEIRNNKNIISFLNENNFDISEELILRREIPLNGNSRCFINDSPSSLSLVKELGNLLIDLHGQHEHQSLLRTETHIDFLDQYAGLDKELAEFGILFSRLTNLLAQQRELRSREKDIIEKKEFYSFQINEIDTIDPKPGEDDILTGELKILENSEKLIELTTLVCQNVYDSDDSVYDQLVKINSSINELVKIDKAFKETEEESQSALNLIKDIAESIRKYNSKISPEPQRLEKIRERLSSLQLLKKKYGGSIDAVLQYRERIGEDFNLAENFTVKLSGIDSEIESARLSCGAAAEKLSSLRNKAAIKIKKEVIDFLKDLGIPGAVFEIKINRKITEVNDTLYVCSGKKKIICSRLGIDTVEFFITTNPGEDVKPLSKVASGGEVSRIMLALKSALANTEKLPLLIFDEIDTGVSGRIAHKVGSALKSISAYHQVIAITHLPQIAGKADLHFAIEKASSGDRVVSSIKILKNEERIREVAKLMSGENITEASLSGAKELMDIK